MSATEQRLRPAPAPRSRRFHRACGLNTQACDLCERLPSSIAEVSPGFAAQVPEVRLEPQVVA